MTQTYWKTNDHITNWDEFAEKVRAKGYDLFARLDEFPDSVLVAGCQRSGTTMLSRIITESDGMVNYWFGPYDELDAALILSGYVAHKPEGRYCFQTTYINSNYQEYYGRSGSHKTIVIFRNPFSVIYSMLYNWQESAIDRLFRTNGSAQLRGKDKYVHRLLGIRGISKLHRACWGYNGKVAQLSALKEHISPDKLLMIDYDDLVLRRDVVLPQIYKFIDLPFRQEYAEKINPKSMSKRGKLTKREVATIQSICEPLYQHVSKLRSPL